MMSKLRDIIYKTDLKEVIGSTDISVEYIAFDSQKVKPNGLFVAIKGTKVDGHKYIEQAIQQGAKAIVCEEFPQHINDDITYVKVNNSHYALGCIASNYYNNPSGKLKLVGVTGTNGKTTTATLLYRLFFELGYKVGLLSTVENKIIEKSIPATHTTPDAIQLNELLNSMVEQGCTHCFMEVSSHAVVQHRIAGITFAGGIFTNITHDHLDFHKTFEEYIKAKKLFFDQLPSSAFALINGDDKNAHMMIQNTKAICKSYALKKEADFKCKILENLISGLHLIVDGQEVWCRLVGRFNAYNLLAIYSSAMLLSEDKQEVLKILSNLSAVDGRFEYIQSPDHIVAIVDYAHTPDALQNVLDTINDLRTGNEQLITVVGAGGDRDASKRPIMARIASEESNKVILTSDNPRSESPEEIIGQMRKGIEANNTKKVIEIVDRSQAIKAACALAKPGDIILVAGKGHEKYQEIKGVKHPFDDKQMLNKFLLDNK